MHFLTGRGGEKNREEYVGRSEEDGTTRLDQSPPGRLRNLAALIAPPRSQNALVTFSEAKVLFLSSAVCEELRSLQLRDKAIGNIVADLAGVPERSAVRLHPAATLMTVQCVQPYVLATGTDPLLTGLPKRTGSS